MAHKVTIECEARFVDHLTDESRTASDAINDIGSAAEKTDKKVDSLGKKKIKPIFDADDNKFLKKIREAEARAKKLGRTKTSMVLTAVDKATNVIGKVLNKGQSFGRSVWSAVLKVKDSEASKTISKIVSAAKSFAGKTWSAIVKIKDYALAPLNKIKNALFNIKTLATAVFAGFAAKQLVLNPIGIADAYASAKIGFQTLLGEQAGQKMMDDLDAFAKETPFNTTSVIAQSQKMLAMGWDAKDIITDMRTIGDAAAATGKGEEGLERIVLALSQIKSKGRLSTEELNQLAEAGISAKRYIAEGLGYGSGDSGIAKMTKDLESGAIGAETALQALIEGMKEYDGMMEKTANETASGLWSQIQDTFEINILRKWGLGLQDGAKRGLGAVVSLLDNADDALKAFGDTIYEVGKAISNWAANKLEKAVKIINEVTQSLEFKNASLGGKVKILWNKVIAEPFSEWWNSTGKKKIADIAGKIGNAIGSAITGGLLVLLGFDAEGAIADGLSIGGSFMKGFLQGFDCSKIGKALTNWISENKGLAAILGTVLAVKILSGIGNAWSNIKGLFGGSKTGGGALSSASTVMMNVQADVVNVFGNGFNSGSGSSGGSGGFGSSGGSGGTGTGTGGGALLLPGMGGAKKLLTGGSGSKGLLTDGGSTVKGLLTGGTSTAGKKILTGVTLKDGTIAATGSKAVAGLAKVGVSLGSGATTAGGAAAAGAAGTLGIAGIAGGTISSIIDLFQGIGKSRKGDSKGAKDEYVTAGTKVGMMGTGAGIGAAIGSIIPGAGTAIGALVGGGIGGIVSLFTGDKAGKALSDATDDGGWLSNAWNGIKGFFTDTIPTKFGELKDGVSGFFTQTLPNAWNGLWDNVGGFFTETIPSVFGTVKDKVGSFFTETIPNAWNSLWDNVGSFFTETVPYAIGFACGKISAFFTETIPSFFGNLWDGISGFFTDTLPTWASNVWNDNIVPFFTESIPSFFSTLWDGISGFFTDTLPTWVSNVWNNNIVPFFTESIPSFFSSLWDGIKGFFTDTLPTWASNVWNNNIVPFFTETIPGFFSSLWNSIKGFFTDTLPSIASTIWNGIKGFFTDTIPSFFSSLWGTVKSWFGAGYSDGKSGSSYGTSKGKARGGIVGGTSSMEAFARGGIVGGSTRFIRVNEESPEMIIPLSSQRRERAMKLWTKTGQLLGVPGFARGGISTGDQDAGLRFQGTDSEPANLRSFVVEVGGIHIEIKVGGTTKDEVIRAIKDQIADIAEDVAGIFADEFGALFENTPVRGEVN